MIELLKQSIDLSIKNRWLKKIDKKFEKYKKMKRKSDCQKYVLNSLIEEYKNIYGVDLPKIK